MLKLLASQAAISLEKAHLYADLDEAHEYLSEAQRLSLTGSFGWVPSSGEIIWSNETCRIFDYDPAIKPTLEMAFSESILRTDLWSNSSLIGHFPPGKTGTSTTGC